MGNYTSETKVEGALQGRVIDATSKPTSTEVGVFITDVEASIDERLRTMNYPTVPITDSNQIAALQPIATAGAAYYTEKACESPRYELIDILYQEFKNGLKDISNGKIIPKTSADRLEHPKAFCSSHVTDTDIDDDDKLVTDDDLEDKGFIDQNTEF